jgi:hypothetical protein
VPTLLYRTSDIGPLVKFGVVGKLGRIYALGYCGQTGSNLLQNICGSWYGRQGLTEKLVT